MQTGKSYVFSLLSCSALALALDWNSAKAMGNEPVYRATIRSTIKSASGAIASAPAPSAGAPGIFRTFSVSFRECPISRNQAGAVDRIYRVYDITAQSSQRAQTDVFGEPPRQVIVDRRRGEELAHGIAAPLRASDVDFIAAHTWIPALQGFLPPSPDLQKPWNASREAAAELAGLSDIESGGLECSDLGVQMIQGQSIRQVAISGVVVGPCADGRTRNRIDGVLALLEPTRAIQSVTATGVREILGEKGQTKEALSVEYELTVAAISEDQEFTPAALAQLPKEPTDDLLMLAWSDPELMLSFVFPRAWSVRRTGERDVLLSLGSNSLVLHPEPEGKTPTTAEYADEVNRYLTSNRHAFSTVRPPQEAVSTAGRIGHFQFATTLERTPIVLDYWVVQRGSRGATMAGRVEPDQATRLASDIERIVRSLRFLSPRPDSQ